MLVIVTEKPTKDPRITKGLCQGCFIHLFLLWIKVRFLRWNYYGIGCLTCRDLGQIGVIKTCFSEIIAYCYRKSKCTSIPMFSLRDRLFRTEVYAVRLIYS